MRLKIHAADFWPGFSLAHGFIRYLLTQAVGDFDIAEDDRSADIVVRSLFPRFARLKRLVGAGSQRFQEKSIGFIWENSRPDYRQYRFSVSSDFDDYGGRNTRVPYWYSLLNWPGLTPDRPDSGKQARTLFEPLVEIETLLQPRPAPGAGEQKRFCCFVAANREEHRMFAVDQLSKQIGKVDLYGPISGTVFRGSKFDLLAQYEFTVCFENSAFPGYYTEKMLHAWVGGCIPLYYSDPWYERDFNAKAAVNRIHFRTIADFVDHVATLKNSPAAMEEMRCQPLLLQRPSIEPAVLFLRNACAEILRC